MRGNEFLDKMGLVDPAYVEAADRAPGHRKSTWVRWGAVAACLIAAISAGYGVLNIWRTDGVSIKVPFIKEPAVKDPSMKDPSMKDPSMEDPASVSLANITRPYREASIMGTECAIVWPWEYMTVSEQYTGMEFDNRQYSSKAVGRALSAALLGEALGSCEAAGADPYTGQEHRMTFEVYRINGISEKRMVAVDLNGEFHVFQHSEYDPPADFGELLDDYSLPQTLGFDRFTVCEGYKDKEYYSLGDDEYIWQILASCRDAVFVEDDPWNSGMKNYISFTATSEALGVYKRVFYVSADGYISTNVFDWGYTFDIGEAAAGKIISYAVENGTETEPEPYMYSLTGTLTEIGEGYILVDDSVLCVDQKDGMVFKVPTDDLRISRYIETGKIKAGDVVQVSFTEDIDVEAGNLVNGVCDIADAIISDGEVWVLE